MLSVRWGERALPLAWRVAETEGAIGFATQQELLEVVAGWLSVGQAVILLADRFYGTPEMICWCGDRGWDYRLRLKGNLVARLGATRTTTGALALSGGHYFENILLTGKRITTNLGIIRDPGHTEPWIIAMSAKPGYLTTLGYAARWGIEPILSDFKSRGFGLQQTHLRYPDRLARLILVMALALYSAVSTGMSTKPTIQLLPKKTPGPPARPSSPAEDCPGSPVASGAPSSFSSNASRSQSLEMSDKLIDAQLSLFSLSFALMRAINLVSRSSSLCMGHSWQPSRAACTVPAGDRLGRQNPRRELG